MVSYLSQKHHTYKSFHCNRMIGVVFFKPYLIIEFTVTSHKFSHTPYFKDYDDRKPIHNRIKELEDQGLGYRRISHILTEKGYRSVRTNSILKNNYIHSIYKKGKIRESRIERSFDSKIENIKYIFKYYE